MEEMRQSLWRVEKLVENGERDRSVAEVKIRESLGQLDSKVRSGGVEGMKPVTDKVLQMDSNHLGLSMRLDGLAEVVDKHLFKSKGRAGERPGADVDNKNVLQLISDVGKIRDELAFKCDGAFVKTTLDGKANKQSVADALHGKANKKTIARELAEMKGLLIGELKKVRVQIDSVGSTNGLPVSSAGEDGRAGRERSADRDRGGDKDLCKVAVLTHASLADPSRAYKRRFLTRSLTHTRHLLPVARTHTHTRAH